jgi:hypothetical protein
MKIQHNCDFCKRKIPRKPWMFGSKARNYFCSVLCRNRWLGARKKRAAATNKTCKFCKRSFVIARWQLRNKGRLRLYCSYKCHKLDHTKTVNCALCGKLLIIPNSKRTRSKNHFCSAQHHYTFWKNSTNSSGVDRHGYIWVRINGSKRKMQHRVVMEKRLGRLLHPHEKVHHLNGRRADNRDRNLELWSVAHPAGQRVSDKIKWAREFLKLYGFKIGELYR